MAQNGNARRILLGSVAALVVIAGGAGLAVKSMLDPDALRTKAIAAIEKQTGRKVRMGGLELHVLPTLSLSVSDVGLSDMAGGAYTDMVTADKLQASMGLMALLHHEIRLEDLKLVHPVVHLERTDKGQANWRLSPDSAQATATPDARTAQAASDWKVQIGSIRISNADLDWDDRMSGSKGKVVLDHINLSDVDGAKPEIDVAGHNDSGSFTLAGHTGAINLTSTARAGWPVALQAAFRAGGQQVGQMAVDGTVADPDHMKGYNIRLDGNIASLKAIEAFVPGLSLPDVRRLSLKANVVDGSAADKEGSTPLLNSLHLDTGAVDAGQYLSGLTLQGLSVDAPGPKDAVTIRSQGTWQGQGLKLSGTLGSLQQVEQAALSHLADPLPLSLDLSGDPGSLRVAGTLGGSRAVVNVNASAGKLPLPNGAVIDHLEASTHLVSEDNGAHFQLSDIAVKSTQVSLKGALDLSVHGGHAGVPLVSGAIDASWVNADALMGNTNATKADASTVTPANGKGSDETLPFDRLRKLDADLRLTVAQLEFEGDEYHNALTHISLRNGLLKVDPLQAEGTGRRLSGQFEVDASGSVPTVSGTIGTLVLPATWLESKAGLSNMVQGALQVVGEVRTQGNTATELRTGMTGHLGVSMVNGTVSGSALGELLGDAARGALGSGPIALRCFGLHMNMADKKANVDTIGVQTNALTVTGKGTVGMVSHDLDLHLVPQVMIGGTGATVPLRVGGTLSSPRPKMDGGADGRYAIGLLLGGSDSKAVADPCPATLKVAREGQAGPEPTTAAPKAQSSGAAGLLGNSKSSPDVKKAAGLLKGLGILK
ncbi:lipopolysaccharide biogenesis periplasmic protein [Komagataeibacter europaeus NBRC 3261]|uniref:Lipopolysaccharide biogenesis periplasmic protein n=1 Tax=Komagataeibacter europaeus NBRC 3261 TaxID=1234669 RepID=A0A0D6Q206_KOMEU|nr:AsmA family protein [Komagataeibacter europaeus]GAN97612.1 lipopolysaccharide biogenesis periplasmic protein [Komagataeibacter europaeus NBRC 3261]